MNHARFVMSAATLTLFSGLSFAQQREVPYGWYWQPHPKVPGSTTYYESDPRCASAASVDVFADGPDPDDTVAHAKWTAAWIATTILWPNYQAGRITEDTMVITLLNFGYDGPGVDVARGVTEMDRATRFFQDEDRLPGIEEWAAFSSPFPDGRPNDPERSARAYRQPFIRFATLESTARTWMIEFMKELNDIIEDPEHPNHVALPDPTQHAYRFLFDCEASVTRFEKNSVFILHELASRQNIWGAGTSTNAGWPVPGSPGWTPQTAWPGWTGTMPSSAAGMSLGEMYDAVKAAYGWPNSILDATDGLKVGEEPYSEDNLPFLTWYYSIAQRSMDAALWNSAYSVIKDYWPNAICGNYDASDCDGQIDTTGWLHDIANSNALINEYPRTIVYRQPSEGLMAQANLTDRWLTFFQGSLGDRNCPFLYPVNYHQMVGHYPGQDGHWTPNPYLLSSEQFLTFTDDEESPEFLAAQRDTSLRLDRRDLESVIYSNPASGDEVGRHEASITRWAAQVYHIPPYSETPPEYPPHDFYHGKEETLRASLADGRAFDVPEYYWWLGAGEAPEITPEQLEYAYYYGWKHSRELLRRVYSFEVTQVKPVKGDRPVSSQEYEPAQLEYALRGEDGNPITADVDEETSTRSTILQVEFTMDAARNPNPLYGVEINVECQGTEHAEGTVWAYKVSGSATGWVPVPLRTHFETTTSSAYTFPTPDRTTRRTFLITRNAQQYVDAEGKMLVRLKHTLPTTASETLLSRYDLVQVIPFPHEADSYEEEESLALSDVDMNGVVDASDYEQFVESWASQQTLADVTLEGDVSLDDLDEFTASFMNTTP